MDHVDPIAGFDLTDDEETQLCFNWRNMSPLKGQENLEKNDKIDKEQMKRHLQKLKEFHKLKGMVLPEKFNQLYAKHLK